MRSFTYGAAALAAITLLATVALAIGNPDISIIGQMRSYTTDAADDLNRERLQFAFDEAEIVADAALNPFAHGTFVFALIDGEAEVEEGYFTINRGLPQGLGVKAGKYRVAFGKLNPVHPHAYPFVERFRVLEVYLPGEESYNEIGGQLSYRLPLHSDLASTLSFDLLQGNSFHPDTDASRPAWLGRWANFFAIGEQSNMEIGVSASQGTHDVAAQLSTTLIGADLKAKLKTSALNTLVLQGELLSIQREQSVLEPQSDTAPKESVNAVGGYVFADYQLRKRYNAGCKYERYQLPEADKPWEQALGVFAGVALFEETTLFRLNWDRAMPDAGDAVNTVTLQAVFSMGPHKPHQF